MQRRPNDFPVPKIIVMLLVSILPLVLGGSLQALVLTPSGARLGRVLSDPASAKN
ncbi:rCG49021, partial [Rattus norvegicus]